MKSQFKGHNYIVVYKYDDKCKVKPFKTMDKARKYFDKMKNKCTWRWRSVVLMDTYGRVINQYTLY